MSRRWRPSLALVLGGALAGTLTLSFAGLVALRYLGPEIGFRGAAILLAALITLATAILGWLLVRLLLRPLLALEAYAEAQERGTAASPPAHFGTRELHATARRVMSMADALRDREATVRSYTDHVTHEIKTPVSAIRAAVEMLAENGALDPSDARLLGEVDGARRQIERQLAALRSAAQARETRHLGTCTLADVLPGLQADHPETDLRVEGGSVPLPIGARGMAIVLHQLMRNAVEHGASKVSLSAAQGERGALLDIGDDGNGISDGNVEHVFEPFFSTKREQGGTGMGLVVVRNLLRAHGADIVVLPFERGARFRISFSDPS